MKKHCPSSFKLRILTSGVSLLFLSVLGWAQLSGAQTFVAPTGEEMLFSDDPKDWSRPQTVIPPAYPSAELKAGSAGYVDVEVKVNEIGRVISSRIVKSMPENKAFESATAAQINLWTFHPKLTAECAPTTFVSNVRVWFENRNGEGVISVSGTPSTLAPPEKTAARKAEFLNRKETISSVRYPEALRKSGTQANVYSVITVDAATGNAKAVDISWIKATDATELTKLRLSNAIKLPMMDAKFIPTSGSNYKVCIPFTFRLTT